ncbi:hypothetical protein E5288_WYG000919 [Bos mutus]|uniref:Uncharacterized protein n=1 Tax=Bos mutus TaxID=72004 RepID=A0A6B0RLA6_9CETA|nr:hypothetical protein [Bos mutus]
MAKCCGRKKGAGNCAGGRWETRREELGSEEDKKHPPSGEEREDKPSKGNFLGKGQPGEKREELRRLEWTQSSPVKVPGLRNIFQETRHMDLEEAEDSETAVPDSKIHPLH